jgi:hypothetical protein
MRFLANSEAKQLYCSAFSFGYITILVGVLYTVVWLAIIYSFHMRP